MLSVLAGALIAFAPADPQAAGAAEPTPAPPAAAAPAATPPAAAAAASPKEEDPIVCKNQVVAGSRLPVKVCQRTSEIEARKRSGRNAVDKLQLNNSLRGPQS